MLVFKQVYCYNLVMSPFSRNYKAFEEGFITTKQRYTSSSVKLNTLYNMMVVCMLMLNVVFIVGPYHYCYV